MTERRFVISIEAKNLTVFVETLCFAQNDKDGSYHYTLFFLMPIVNTYCIIPSFSDVATAVAVTDICWC